MPTTRASEELGERRRGRERCEGEDVGTGDAGERERGRDAGECVREGMRMFRYSVPGRHGGKNGKHPFCA